MGSGCGGIVVGLDKRTLRFKAFSFDVGRSLGLLGSLSYSGSLGLRRQSNEGFEGFLIRCWALNVRCWTFIGFIRFIDFNRARHSLSSPVYLLASVHYPENKGDT